MSQFFFDPNDWAVGDSLSTPGFPFFVLRGAAVVQILNDGDGSGNYLKLDAQQSGRNILAFSPAGQTTDTEIYLQIDDTPGTIDRIGVRSREDGAGGDFYQFRDGSIDTVINGSLSPIASGPAFLKNVRFRANGTSPTTLQVVSWGDVDEPVSWDATVTNSASDLQVAGYAALTPFREYVHIRAFGVGTNGDAAPTAPVATAPVTPINLTTTNILPTSARLGWE